MENFDLIGALNDKAKENQWVFLSGSDAYQNIDATLKKFEDGQKVLTVDVSASATFATSLVTAITYDGIIMLGLKADSNGIRVSLDESFNDKYNRRLKELHLELSVFLGAFACENELTIENAQFTMEINRFDTNIDFIAARIRLTQ
jgi:hypothetical protein